MKNPQFLTNFSQTFRNWPIYGGDNLWKFLLNWSKIVDFSLLPLKIAIPKRGAQVCTIFYPFWKRNFENADDQRIFEFLRYVWAFFIKNAEARFTIYFLLKKSWISNYSSITAKYLTGYWLFSDAKTPPPLPNLSISQGGFFVISQKAVNKKTKT